MFYATLLRISASHMLIIIHQGSRHDAGLRAQQARNQSGQLVGFYQLPHGLGSLRFRQPICSHAVELLLSHALAWVSIQPVRIPLHRMRLAANALATFFVRVAKATLEAEYGVR